VGLLGPLRRQDTAAMAARRTFQSARQFPDRRSPPGTLRDRLQLRHRAPPAFSAHGVDGVAALGQPRERPRSGWMFCRHSLLRASSRKTRAAAISVQASRRLLFIYTATRKWQYRDAKCLNRMGARHASHRPMYLPRADPTSSCTAGAGLTRRV